MYTPVQQLEIFFGTVCTPGRLLGLRVPLGRYRTFSRSVLYLGDQRIKCAELCAYLDRDSGQEAI